MLMTLKRLALSIGALGGAVLFGFTVPALADSRDISLGGVWVCEITHDASGYTAAERVVEVHRRITELLSIPAARQGVTLSVQPQGANAVILAGGMLIFTVTPNDTIGSSTSPLQLARQWASRFGEGLSRALPQPTPGGL